MDTFEAIYSRRATRDFALDKKIPLDILHKIMDAARYVHCGPSGAPPWRIISIRDETTRNMVADAAKEATRMLFGGSFEVFGGAHMWYMSQDLQVRVAENTATGELWEYPRTADVMFVPVFSQGGWVDMILPWTSIREVMAQYEGMATQNMWLVGTKYGIGAGYNAVPLADIRRREVITDQLGIPSSWAPTGGFCFGYQRVPRLFGPARQSIEGIVRTEYWGNHYRREALRKEDYEKMAYKGMDIEDAVKNLNVVSSFKKEPVPDWMIEQIIDAALWGPAPENFRSWRLIIVRDKKSKDFIYNLVKEKKHCPWTYNYPELQYSRVTQYPPDERVERMENALAGDYEHWLAEADVLLIVTAAQEVWVDYPYAGGMIAGPNPPMYIAAGSAVQNMMIAATALGLGVNYEVTLTGDRRDSELLADFFGIPSGTWNPMGILALGKAGQKAELPSPPTIENLFLEECWGRPYTKHLSK